MIKFLQNTITDTTRQHAILDPILIPDDLPYLDSGTLTIPSEISDHKATFIRFPFQYHCQKTYERLVLLYKKANFDQLKQLVVNHNWDRLYDGSINEAFEKFTDNVFSFVKTCIPSKLVTIRPDDKSWFDSEIRHFSRIRDRLKRKALKSGNSNDCKKYKHARNKVNNFKKHAKENFYNNLELSLSEFYNNDKKKFWQVIRHFVKNKNTSDSIPPLITFSDGSRNVYCFSDEEKAECLNNFFTSIWNVDDSNTHLPIFQVKYPNTLSDISCTAPEIEILINSLNPNKSTGPDNISNRMLKAVAKEISVPLSIVFNRSFAEGVFANSLKVWNVLPLYKKDDKSLPSNYRPISLLSNIGNSRNVLYSNIFTTTCMKIFSFTNISLAFFLTIQQLIRLSIYITTFAKHLIMINSHACFFCDVSKAFHRVWHKGLIFTLKQYGICWSLLNCVTDYLSNRTQRVVIRSCLSTLCKLMPVSPKDLFLGPLLFLIYINDIADSLLSLTRLFADDSSLFCSASLIQDLEGIINHDLKILAAWAKQWLINVNPLKTEALLFTLNCMNTSQI